ncbi:hypothetical protein CBH50_005092 [Salmonella enterica subsp. diarizonae serovar 60:r:e,n,x,z15]|nr:hypothetical protein [Salmonella enterica subsp. diarizonae serovar 60:r:e,n,x,z15]
MKKEVPYGDATESTATIRAFAAASDGYVPSSTYVFQINFDFAVSQGRPGSGGTVTGWRIYPIGSCRRQKTTTEDKMKDCINALTSNAHECSKNYLYKAAYFDGGPGDPVGKDHMIMLIENYAYPKLKNARMAVTDDAETKYLKPGPHKVVADSTLMKNALVDVIYDWAGVKYRGIMCLYD